ncbi:hypothetical protein CGRA01v4_11566 [Colletotrichum graminicola]|nr:hypothetical protein CGRA01v4_11566 [Colletotrichum graminicola]
MLMPMLMYPPPPPCQVHGPCPMLFERALLRTATAVPIPHQHQQSADTAVPQYLFFILSFFILPQLAPARCTILRWPGWACGLWTVDGWTSTCLLFFSHHRKQNLPTPVFFLFFLPLTTPPTTSNIPPRTAKEARTVSQTDFFYAYASQCLFTTLHPLVLCPRPPSTYNIHISPSPPSFLSCISSAQTAPLLYAKKL